MAHHIIGNDGLLNPHKILHGNISLLLNFYPPPDDQFKDAFKENMFMLPNKKGFFQVTNYINSTIDKQKWNSIITWPVINNKDEMKFRRAVVKFTADLNSMYDVPVVPTLVPSVLISPGGLQVAKFILKLSEYAIRKYMEESLGIENTLQCLKFNSASSSAKLKLEAVALHKNVQCLNVLEAKKRNFNYALEQKKHMQQQLLKIRASNADIEREIIQEAPDNNSQEHVEQWSNELNKRIEKRQNYVDYLAGIVPIDVPLLFLKLALELKSSESKHGDSQLTSSVQRIESEISLERMSLELIEKDILSHIAESQKAISDLEPKAFSSIIDEEKIPDEIKNYAASPALSFAKTNPNARRLPIACPPRENSILDWVKNNLFKETDKVPSNRNTPLKRDTVSLIPKKGLIVKKPSGLSMQSTQSPIRLQNNLQKGPETPKRNSLGPVRRLIQEVKTETPKPKSLEDEGSIVLPHDLSVSTASPCNSPMCVSPDSTPKGLSWQPAVPSPVSNSTAVSSITSPNTWAEQNEIDFFSSTPLFMIHNTSVCSSTAEKQSQDICQSSPSGAVHLPADMNTTGNKHRKMRPSLENIIARYKALKRNQQEQSNE
ncbi:hypothetical protein LSTR_LSTR006782 [Laodelphax striatellus]|uniref:HAUS augmin-like complex subunit 6 N-terminal domain-containing protein n=1 Tax=Laodelphax striatellus TaxID=195883 RepID=A0A482WRS8_LAOST|nr:hypothetical protein LSTR_LSTR006782 [Laodelphax striatellus]